MGLGDQLMGTGMARGAAARGKCVAFGDGSKIMWDHNSEEIFRDNPNIAPPGSEGAGDLEWVPFYKGHRIYNRSAGRRWIWNMEFRATPGEVFFTDGERDFGRSFGKGFVLIEANVPPQKTVASNKTWPFERYQEIAKRLRAAGYEVRQFRYKTARLLRHVETIAAPNFRHALAVLANAALYVGPEGGLHHGAAAVGIPAVVLFGGFIPPQVTGYEAHINLTGGAKACGSLKACRHCEAAMAAISVDEVERACLYQLKAAQPAQPEKVVA